MSRPAENDFFLVMTRACNLRCSYCSQGQGKPLAYGEKVDPKKVAGYFPSEGRIVITLYGGEPTLDFDYLIRVVDAIRERNDKVEFRLITNGVLLTVEKAKLLNDRCIRVSLSHDGPFIRETRGCEDILAVNPEPFLTLNNRAISSVATNWHWNFYDFWEYFEDFKIRNGLPEREQVYINMVHDAQGVDAGFFIKDNLEFEKMLDKVFTGLYYSFLTKDTTAYEYKQYLMWIKTLEYRIRTGRVGGAYCNNLNRADFTLQGRRLMCHNVDTIYDPGLTTAVREKCKECPVEILCRGGCLVTDPAIWDHQCYTNYQQMTRLLSVLHALNDSGVYSKEDNPVSL